MAAIAIAVAMLALFLARMDTGAVHNEGLLEMDGNVAYDSGDGFDPGTNNCPFSVAGPDSGDPDDCISNPAAFDWADTCDRTSGGDLAGYITKAASQPAVLAGSDVICQPDFVIGATDDLSYHTGSDKDFQEIFNGTSADWGCQTSANATSKADILNTYFIVTEVAEADGPHQVVYIGAERDSEHGSVFNGYWILQDGLSVPGSTTTAGQLDCTPNAPLDFSGQHFCGDVLVRFNYTSGGRIGGVRANEWVAPSPGFVGTFIAANGCDQIAGNADDCTASQQASAETHTIPGGFLCDRPPAQGDCRSAADQTAPGDDLCGRVNGATDCTIRASHNEPFPPPCSGPGEFTTEWEPGDGSPASDVVAPPTFSEMGIDLTGLGLELPCISTLITESRSSPAVDATLKDFAMAPTGSECVSEIRTEIHSASDNSDANLDGGTVYGGTPIHDVAFVKPIGPGGNATGTVTFHLYSGQGCTGTPTDEDVTITDQIPGGIPSGTEGAINSTEIPSVSGDLSYTAEYSGDGTYAGAGPSDCENLHVINPTTTLDKSLAFSTEVTYTYTESNDGDDPLDPPTAGDLSSFVTDPDCVAAGGSVSYASGDDGNEVLDPGETFTFTCTVTITSPGAYANTGTGHGTDSLGRDVTNCGAGVTGPNDGNFCDPDETDSTSITITVDQGKP